MLGYFLFLGVYYLLKEGYKKMLKDNVLGKGSNIVV